MDRTLIENALESRCRCLARLRAKCPATAAALAQVPVAAVERPAPEAMGQPFDLHAGAIAIRSLSP